MTRVTSPEAERSVLGAAIIAPEILGWLDLGGDHFFDLRNKHVWSACSALCAAQISVDPVTLEEQLVRQGSFESLGGVAYLTELASCVGTADNVEHYAEILRDKLIARETLAAASESKLDVTAGLTGADILDELLGRLSRIERSPQNEDGSISQAAKAELALILKANSAEVPEEISPGILTGIEALDRETGGIPIGKPSALGGRPGLGKSSLLLTIADNASARGQGVLIFTYEDRRDAFAQRMLSKYGRIPLDIVATRKLGKSQLTAAMMATDELAKRQNLHIIHAHGMTVDRVCRIALALRRRIGLRLIGVDYIQNMPSPLRGLKKHEAIEENMLRLANFAAQQSVAMLVLSQVKQEVEKENRRPRLSDFRHSDSIGIIAKLALFLHEPGEPNVLEILIEKNSQGGAKRVCKVTYEKQFCEIH